MAHTVFSQEAKISKTQTNQRNFFLTFGPVIRKLFTDLEERKTTDHNGGAPTHFCCRELEGLLQEIRFIGRKGKRFCQGKLMHKESTKDNLFNKKRICTKGASIVLSLHF